MLGKGGHWIEQGPQGGGRKGISPDTEQNPGHAEGQPCSRDAGGAGQRSQGKGGMDTAPRRGPAAAGTTKGATSHSCRCPEQGPEAVCPEHTGSLFSLFRSHTGRGTPWGSPHVPSLCSQVLTVSRNGSVYLLDVAGPQVVCAFAPPRPCHLAAAWKPACVVSLHHPYFLLRGRAGASRALPRPAAY